MEALITRVDDDEVTITVMPRGKDGPEYEIFFRKSAIVGTDKPYQISVFGDESKLDVISFPGHIA